MMKRIFSIAILVLSGYCLQAQSIPVYNADMLMKRVANQDTFYVVNFWATWCGPCVKELPEFDKLKASLAGKPVKILLVSLDFKDAYPKKIEAFAKRK